MVKKRGGQPGNDGGSKDRIWGNAIRRALARRSAAEKTGGTVEGGLNALADQFLNAVADGGVSEFKEMADRLDGKAHQAKTIETTVTKKPRKIVLTTLKK